MFSKDLFIRATYLINIINNVLLFEFNKYHLYFYINMN